MAPAKFAPATTCTGELTVAPSEGVETQIDPAELELGVGGGSGAGSGNAATPEVGPCAWTRVTVGHVEGCGVGVGVGLGVPLGGGEFVFIEVIPPHAASIMVASSTASSPIA